MALASWAALYTDVVRDLMARRKEPELLLLLAIAGHADPFGFCFPGKKALMTMRHCGEDTFLRRRQWLVDEGYIKYQEVWNPRRRQMEPDYQINPRSLYLREEIQEYCELVWEGSERDFTLENNFLVTLFSTKVSQTEESDSETDSDQHQNPDSGTSERTRQHNQLSATRASTGKKQPQGSTMRSHAQKQKQPAAGTQREAQNSEPQSAPVPRDYEALHQAWYYTDDETLAREIKTAVATSISQARQAVRDYPREWVIHWAIKCLQRRDAGDLTNPGAWFFKILKSNSPDNEGLRLEAEERGEYSEMEV